MTKSHYRNFFDLSGKVAVVTGAVGILGQRFCRGLAEFGANIAWWIWIWTGVQPLPMSWNMTMESRLSEFLRCLDPHRSRNGRYIVSRFGSIQILHNNAASKSTDLDAFFSRTEEYSLSEWRKIMSVNVDGMFLVAQAVGRQMQKQGTGGSIIQTASIYGILSSDKRIYEGSFYLGRQISNPAVYSTSKAAVVGLTRYLAGNWGDAGIRVNALVPVESRADKTTPLKRAIPLAYHLVAWRRRMRWSAHSSILPRMPRAMLRAIAWLLMVA